MSGVSRRGLAFAAALCLFLSSVAAQRLSPEGAAFSHGASLPLEGGDEVRALYARLQAAVDRADGESAARLYAELRARPGTELLRFGPRTHMPAIELAARLVEGAGDGPVRQAVAKELAGALAAARAARDLPALLDLATRGTALGAVREAELLAARLAFERGEWHLARALAQRAAALPGAAALAAAAAVHIAPEPAAPTPGAPVALELQGGRVIGLRVDDEGRAAVPWVGDGAPGEVLVVEGDGLLLLDRHDSQPVEAGPWLWGEHLPPVELDRLQPPSPVRHTAVRSGPHLVLNWNALARPGWRQDTTARQGRLAAFDVGPPLRLRWAVRPPGTGSAGYGVPAIVGDRVLALLYRSGLETEVALVAHALDDGRLLFEVPLARAAHLRRYEARFTQSSAAEADKRPRETALLVRDGLVHAATGLGVLATVDALSGRVRWLFRYERLAPFKPFEFSPAGLFDTGSWDDEPLRVWGERLVLAPSDSRYLYVLANEPGPAGQLILDDPIERLDRRHVVALLAAPDGGDSPAVLCTRERAGRAELELLAPGGATLAVAQPFPEAVRLTGRPLLLRGRAFVPTRAGLWALDPARPELGATVLRHPASLPPAVTEAFALDEGLATVHTLVQPAPLDSRATILWYRWPANDR